MDTRVQEWQKVKALFNAALDRPPDQRQAFVASAAADDTSLRAAVESLLAAHDESGGFLERPAVELHEALGSDALPADGRAGPYRLLREIGRGGMGTVYLSARDDGEFRHQVAVKLVKRGMDSDLILRRFRHERQILAELDHPNVARLLDGGTTTDGRPYFVMEYVEGEPIDRFCETRHLDVRERLALFRVVCAAVQYAHQNLIVHRDIKPNNILVTSAMAPKLLDFGIAKLLDPAAAPSAGAAPTTALALTPEYASPEQVRGEPITTATDVYSLGVLLYELLAGRRPYEVTSTRVDEIARTVCDTNPPLPSEAVTGDHASELRRRLRGDLDTIVLKAMHKEPRRRYTSVDQLSEDIERHLSGRPVLARRDTLAYRLAKFTRRNRIGIAAAAVVLASLIGGLATTLWQARVAQAQRVLAEKRFDEVRTLATSFLFELHDAIANLPGATTARALLVQRARTSLDGLARDAEGDLPLQLELAAAYERVGLVQGNSYNANLGDTQGALNSYRKSLEIRERVAREHPGSDDAQDGLARGYHGVADILGGMGELTEALAFYERALAIRRALLTKNAGDDANRAGIAELYNSIGDTKGMDGYANLGDVPGALESYGQSVAMREAIFRRDPKSRDARVGLASSLMNLGYLRGVAGDTAGIAQVRGSIDLLERVVAEDPNDAMRRLELTSGYARLRQGLADANLLDEALAVDREMISTLEHMATTDPANTFVRRTLGVAHNYLGRDLRASSNPSRAIASHRTALAIAQRLAAADDKSVEHRHDVAITRYYLAEALSAAGQPASALEEYRRAAVGKEALRLREPSNTRHADELALIYTGMSNALTDTKDFVAALASSQKAIPLAEVAAARRGSIQKAKANAALAYSGAGRLHAEMAQASRNAAQREAEWREAQRWYRKSLEIWQEMTDKRTMLPVYAPRAGAAARALEKCDAALSH